MKISLKKWIDSIRRGIDLVKERINSEYKNLFIPIGLKIIIITSLIVITSLLGVAALSSYFFRKDNEVTVMEETLTYSTLIAKKINSDVVSIIDKTRLPLLISSQISNQNEINENENIDIYSLLFKNDPDIICTAVLRKGWNNPSFFLKKRDSLIDTSSILERIKAERPNLERVFDGDSFIFNPSVYFNEPVIGLAAPLETAGNRGSIILVMFSMDKMSDIVESQGVIKSFIVNGLGDVIWHYDSSIARSNVNMASLRIVELMMSDFNPNGQTFYTDETGERYLAAFQRLEFTDAAVISIVPERVAFAAVYKILRIIFYITLISLSSAVIFILIFSRSLTDPIKRLVSAANTIQGGDFSVVVPKTYDDEIGRLSVSFTEMAQGLAEREKIKDAFGKFVNKEVAELALKGNIKLGGERKDAVIFFCDMRSFAEISEKLQPEEVVEFLNEYMALMVECINSNHGSIDKFIGDAIMAVWGVPISRGNDAENSINCALMMREVLIKFNKERGSVQKPIIKIGCGINTGNVLVGQIGSLARMDYTVIGDAVNFASRIESLNKLFGTDILISVDTYNSVKEIFNVEPMQKINIKGRDIPQQVYAVLGKKDDPNCPENLSALRELVGIKHVPGELMIDRRA